MKNKIIKNILLLLIIVGTMDFFIGSFLRYFYFKESSGLHYRTTYAMKKTKAEVLIFGASRANHHYYPEIFEDSLNLSYYNVGRDGQDIFYQLAILKSVLVRYKPKIIILDYLGNFQKTNTNAYERLTSLLPYYKNHPEIRNIVLLKSPFEKLKLQSQIYPFNSDFITILLGNLEFNKKRKPDNKGYVALYGELNMNIDSITNSSHETTDLDPILIDAFTEFVTLIKKSGIQLYVVKSPIFQKPIKTISDSIGRDVCVKNNVQFLDYSNSQEFLKNSMLFQDELHLNNNGAIVFSNLIVEKIKSE